MQSGFSNLIELLSARAREQPRSPAYAFLRDGEAEEDRLDYGELEARSRAVAARLAGHVEPGGRVLLLYPPGLDFIVAFLGCLYAGVVAVPAYPPGSRRQLPRLRAIAADAGPALALTDAAHLDRFRGLSRHAPELRGLRWSATGADLPPPDDGWRPPPVGADTLAFLQYTSGSTATPKGVEIRHGNLLANEATIRDGFGLGPSEVILGWLPLYHDMGLIGNVLQPLYLGAPCVLMSPVAFLRRPLCWLRAIDRYRATVSGGPDFAYRLCADKVSAAERRDLDLSSWRVAFNGAEPVRPETLELFAATFAECGFERRAFYPCYGLAEATLFVSGGEAAAEPVVRRVDAGELERHRVTGDEAGGRALAGCGRPRQELAIVDPERGTPCPPGTVGEVWVAGPSVARGYWNRPEESLRTFGARLASGAGPYLRTGDLGFVDGGELFLTGRLKDLIILRGRNLYPQDLEWSAANSHAALLPGAGAAFAVDSEGEERLVVVQEIERRRESEAPAAAEAIRQALAAEHQAQAHEVLVVRLGTVEKTSSGKVRRRACRSRYLEGELPALARSLLPAAHRSDDELLLGDNAPERGELAVGEVVRREAARALRLAPAALDAGRPLTVLGLDSLAAVELQHALEAELEVSVSVEELLSGLTVDEIEARASALRAEAPAVVDEPAAAPSVVPAGLSEGQKALWFLSQLAPASVAYHLTAAARVRGGLDAAALRRALARLTARHPSLRTVFRADEAPAGPREAGAGEPRPVTLDEEAPACEILEVEVESLAGEHAGGARARLADLLFRPFDLERGPLLRVAVLTAGGTPEDPWIGLAVHHVAADFRSLEIVAHDLGRLYAEETGSAPERLLEPPPADDFAARQRALLDGPRGERLESYWRGRLKDVAEALELPTDRPRPAVETFGGARVGALLDARLSAGVRALAADCAATPHSVLLAALQALLHRLTGQLRFAVGSPATVLPPELEGAVGYFVNPLPLVAELGGRPSGVELVARAQRTVAEGLAHRDYPFARLAERMAGRRDASRSPLFQVMLAFQRTRQAGAEALAAFALGLEGAELDLGGLALESLGLEERGAPFELLLMAAELADGFGVSLQYKTDLFDAATAGRFVGHFETLLAGLVEAPRTPVARLAILTAAERAQTFHEWYPGPAIEVPDLCLHQLFEAQAARTPDAEALVAPGGVRRTYRELDRRAERLARRLRSLGVGPEDTVGVCMERSAELVAALLAVLKAGGAYVPLDPAYPAERLELMLGDSGARAVLSERRLEPRLPAAGRGAAGVVWVDELDGEGDGEGDGGPAPAAAGARQLAYVLFTSGSTGRPKGVAIEHRGPAALIAWARREFRSEELAGVLAATSICFDLSIFEIFLPLSCGGRVILAPDALALGELEAAGEVTLVNTVPSAIAELVRRDALPPSVRTVNLAGEPLPGVLVRRLYELPGVERVWNLYGPSEDSTYSTAALVPSGERREPSIGRPIGATRAYVVDGGLEPLPAGVPGELCLAGAGLARGYRDRPAATAERFQPDPLAARPGERLYRTGDLARYRPDGELEFLGRRDHQVKLRGYRIELGEVEAALGDQPAVRSAVTGIRHDPSGQPRLVAWWVAESGDRSDDELRRRLRARLPAYMVPEVLVELAELPLTPNGKIDRRALPEPDWRAAGGGLAGERAGTPVEELLAQLFCQVLQRDRVARDDDFFVLGGYSLLATQLVSRARQAFGVELSVREVFEAPTVAALARRIEDALGAGSRPAAAIDRLPRPADHALSYAQQRLWFLDQLEPGSAVYNIPAAVDLRGTLAVGVLEAALDEIVRRQEALRTSFPAVAGVPVQRVGEHRRLRLPVVDLTALAPAARRSLGRRLEEEQARAPFDLAGGPLLRAVLLRHAPDRHVLVLIVHHIVSDGWSIGVMIRELTAAYRAFAGGERPRLPELPVQYADFAAWQRRWLAGEVLAAQIAYWRRRLAGLAPLELPTDRPRPAVERFRGRRLPVDLGRPLAESLAALARATGTTLYMTLLAAWQTLLQRTTGQRDLAVGSPIANRGRVEIEGLIGFFANTLVMRGDLGTADGDPRGPSFRELLSRTRETTLAAYAHQDLPFEKLVEEIQPERDMSRNPLFQVMLVLQNAPRPELELPGLGLETREIESGTAKFDLILFLWEDRGRLAGSFEYATDLFDASTAARWLARFATLAAGLAADPDQRLGEASLLPAAERHQVLAEWNDTGVAGAGALPIHRWAEEQARRTPNELALVAGDVRRTFAEVDARANQIAHTLRRLGVERESLVGICVERGADMVVGLLAVLKAGAGAVALDLTYPRDRLAYVIADAGLAALLTHSHLASKIPADGVPRVELDRDGAKIAAESPHSPQVEVDLDHPMYAIYTSGSTGMPKGILVTHRAFLNLLDWQFHRAPLAPRPRTVQYSTFGFCVSFQEIFSCLCAGGTLVLVPQDTRQNVEALWEFLDRHEIERLYLPFAALKQLADLARRHRRLPARLREVVTAGEQLQIGAAIRELFTRLAGCSLHNQYGASETHVVTSHTLTDEPQSWPDISPVGRPVSAVGIHLLDRLMAPVAVGVHGELYAGGACLPRCYLGDPRLTAHKLVPDPFGRIAGGRLYRTGDLARWLAGGEIEYFGRIDTQVKVRGFRVELGEVENALREHPAVRDAAVVARATPGGDQQLVGFVVYPGSGEAAGEAALTAYLKARLPEYMVPSRLVEVADLPLNANGKLDRDALLKLAPDAVRPEQTAAYVAPRDDLEALVAAICAELLGVDRVGVDDNFFESGGHSLLATQLISRVSATLQVELPVRSVFESPTVAGLARAVVAREAAPGQSLKIARVLRQLGEMSDAQAREALGAATT